MTVHRPEPRVDLSPVNYRQRARLAKTSKPVKMGISALYLPYMPSAAGAARGDQRGTPPLDSPEDRGPEGTEPRAQSHGGPANATRKPMLRSTKRATLQLRRAQRTS